MIQLIFEYFCLEYNTAPFILKEFVKKCDNGYDKLSFMNYKLNDPTTKALACTIPWIVNLEEIEFQ